MISESQEVAQNQDNFVDDQDWYSLKGICNDTGLFLELKIFQLETETVQKYSKHLVEQNMGIHLLSVFKNPSELFNRAIKQKQYFISPDGSINFQSAKFEHEQAEHIDLIIQLEKEGINEEKKLKEVIKKLKAQNKKQSQEIEKLKEQAHEIHKTSNIYANSMLSNSFQKARQKKRTQNVLKLQNTDSLKLLTIAENQITNHSGRKAIIVPVLYINQTKSDGFDITLLDRPEQLVVGVMNQFDLGQNKVICQDEKQLPKYFIAFSSKKVRTQRKEYTYPNHPFNKYQIVQIKISQNCINFGIASQNMLQFRKKTQRCFIQLGPGCKIGFNSKKLEINKK